MVKVVVLSLQQKLAHFLKRKAFHTRVSVLHHTKGSPSSVVPLTAALAAKQRVHLNLDVHLKTSGSGTLSNICPPNFHSYWHPELGAPPAPEVLTVPKGLILHKCTGSFFTCYSFRNTGPGVIPSSPSAHREERHSQTMQSLVSGCLAAPLLEIPCDCWGDTGEGGKQDFCFHHV